MWNLLWLLPPALLAWAVALVIRKAKKAGADEEEGPKSLEERLAALDDSGGKLPGDSAGTE